MQQHQPEKTGGFRVGNQFHEQSAQANEVSSAIRNVAGVIDKTTSASEYLAASSEQLGAQATSLRDLVRRFKTQEAAAVPKPSTTNGHHGGKAGANGHDGSHGRRLATVGR